MTGVSLGREEHQGRNRVESSVISEQASLEARVVLHIDESLSLRDY
jgi:hypothetical protein